MQAHSADGAPLPGVQHIYDTAPIGLAFLSPDCRYLQINQRLTEICGLPIADHLGRSVRETVPALADAVEDIVHSVIATGESVIGVEVAGQRVEEPEPRFWTTYWHAVRGPAGNIIGVNVAAEEITERKRAEAALRLVVDELSHRIKNIFSVVIAVAAQTARNADDVADYQRRFAKRLQALAHSHDLLVQDNWRGTSFCDIITAQLHPFTESREGAIETEGPPLILAPNAVQHLGLAFHELATNASKHGALSVQHGRVSIRWHEDSATDRVGVAWREHNGPAVARPQRRGFGRVLIEQLVPKALNGTSRLAFAPDGVSWTLEFARTRNLVG